MIVDSLHDSTRVGKRAGASGVSSLGTSWLSCDGKTNYNYEGKIERSSHNSAVLAVESAQNLARVVELKSSYWKESAHTFALLAALPVATRVKIFKHVESHLL